MFRSDSSLTCKQATGEVGALDVDLSFSLLRGIFQFLEVALDQGDLIIEHVYGHNQDPWNEAADWIAKAEAQKSFFLPRLAVDLRVWRHALPFLWMLVGQHFGCPAFCGEGFDVHPPDVPQVTTDDAELTEPAPAAAGHEVHFCVSIASGNVSTLGVGAQGHAGKLDYIKDQFRALHLNFFGIQEARTSSGQILKDELLRLCSGADGKNLGVEFWCNLALPFAYVDGSPHFLRADNFQVRHRDPRRIVISLHHELWHAHFFVGHAPHSGFALHLRRQWWEESSRILSDCHFKQDLYALIDANAPPGDCDHSVVFGPGFACNSGTPLFRQFLDDLDLCLPSTSALHVGVPYTWTAPDGQGHHLIDFIAIPQRTMSRCTWSQTLEHLDLNPAHVDHLAVGLELQWSSFMIPSGTKTAKTSTLCDRDAICHAPLRPMLASAVDVHWHTDIEAHVDSVNQLFHSALQKHCPTKRRGPKKAFLTVELWEMRKTKLLLRKKAHRLKRTADREFLTSVFRSWQKCMPEHEGVVMPSVEDRHFECTLRCQCLHTVAQVWRHGRALKSLLQKTKKQVLADHLQQLPSLQSASDILRTVKPFMGSSNASKRGPRPLPFVLDASGDPCRTPEDALNRWIQFFMNMEGGERIETEAQRRLWIENLRALCTTRLEVSVTDIPSLVDLEAAFRRVKKGKASGPAQLPSELFHFFPAPVAKQCYAVLLKVALQGQEDLTHKGGTLIPLWKGKGDMGSCSSFRSILLSSHFGKTLHRALRLKQADVYEAYLHKQQLGGRRFTPVTLGTHQARAFLRHHKRLGRPTALLFLDLAEAFYRVVRPLAISGTLSDAVIASMAQRLNLGPDVRHELYSLLTTPSAIVEADLPPHAQRAIQAIHSDTHFALRGQQDRCRTTLGSRPGDAYADVVFGYLWAKVVRTLQKQMDNLNLCEHVPIEDGPTWFHPAEEVPTHWTTFLGPCWCDDLCICMSSTTLALLQTKAANISALLLDLCRTHGMTPNLSKGKTEIMFSMRGVGQRDFRKKWFGPASCRTFPVLGETGLFEIPIVGSYRHLGGILHHTGDLKQEIRRRLALCHQVFTQHRKLLFQNPAIPLPKRVELFRCLVLSKFLFATDSWVISDQRTKNCLHASIMRLYYKRLLKIPADAKVLDDWVLAQTGLPGPSELLRVSRLRYLRTLVKTGSIAQWGLLNLDAEWKALIEDDLGWMHAQLWNSSPLLRPDQHIDQWLGILASQPTYWKRLVSRALARAIGQRTNLFKVSQAHRDLFDHLRSVGFEIPFPQRSTNLGESAFGCMYCGIPCRTRAGEAAHMFKTHGFTHPVRTLFQHTQCAICLTEYHSFGRLKMHLIRNDACRQQWHALRCAQQPMPGIGSTHDDELLRQHDGLLPPLRAAGPHRDMRGRSDFSLVHEALYEDLALAILHASDLAVLRVELRTLISASPISWTYCAATLGELARVLEQESQNLGVLPWRLVLRVINALQDPSSWTFLIEETIRMGEHFHDYLENACSEVRWKKEHFDIPRLWGKHRIVLHAFAGRRRPGDFQFYFDRILGTCEDGVFVHAVSMDIIYDSVLGDASRRSTQEFWFKGIDCSWVVGFLGGPPCESWSKARGVALAGENKHRGPRIIRTSEELWGKEALGLKELSQILIGNDLLLFSILCIYRLALRGGMAVLEHPAEPEQEEAASIWRLQILILLTHFPGIEVLRIMQGHFGAPSPKPTNLLCLNLPSLAAALRQCTVSEQLPRRVAIGLQADGSWATSRLKEYPPALCLALAQCFSTHIAEVPIATEDALVDDFLEQCRGLIVQHYSGHMGQDFAG